MKNAIDQAIRAEEDLFTLVNRQGAVLKVIPFGAVVTELHVPDRDGNLDDVVLGLASPAAYKTGNGAFLGCPVGRTAGRTCPTRVEIDGHAYDLTANEGRNNLHGGYHGLQTLRWDGAPSETPQGPAVTLTVQLGDGMDGYPGNLTVEMTYLLTHDNVLRIEYGAETDRPTLFNPAHHGYFNLGGHASGPIGCQHLKIFAESYVPTGEAQVPLGENAPVAGTPYDFRDMHALSDSIVPGVQGIDYSFILKDQDSSDIVPAAEVWDPGSGRLLRVTTNQNCVQVYTADNLDTGIVAKDGAAYGPQHAICLETQNFANSIHLPDRPSNILRPGDTFCHRTDYAFSVREK